MADDIDDLLDEVETKYCTKERAGRGSKSRPARRKTEEDDLDQVLNDICGDIEYIDTVPDKSTSRVRSNKEEKIIKPKCFPVYIGGSSCPQGVGNSFTKSTCDKLRCTDCDFRVVSFDNYAWHPDVDYLFLRNHVPDFQKLQAKLVKKNGSRAYCCQCRSTSVTELTELKDPTLKWVCGKH
ncbi:hypothetical protein ACJMK2_009515 [Sinanodonta woodiana]|uniref:Cilia- and flagella-associated protein 418 n=1 Tax=Sinanodonta woodiana TaxID=1069815 RepID=A0ABD3VCS4_SINWO